jgi:hypothetical protein
VSVQRISNSVGCTPISFGAAPLSGTISAAAEMDCFTFSGSVGERVLLYFAQTSGTMSLEGEIYNPNGTLLCNEVGNLYNCLLTQTGTHTILLRDYYNTGTGGYGVSVQRISNSVGCTPISFGAAPLSGTISAAAEMDCFTFSDVVGNHVLLSFTKTSGTMSLEAEIYNPNGTLLCNQVGTLYDCLLTQTGQHTVILRDYFSTGTGTYNVSISYSPSSTATPTLTPTRTMTPSKTVSATPSLTFTPSPSVTRSVTPSATFSRTPSITPSRTATSAPPLTRTEPSASCVSVPMTLVGNASLASGNQIQLTSAELWQVGAAWSQTQVSLNLPFVLEVDIYLGTDDHGGDGMAFLFQNVSGAAINSGGGALGYWSIAPSITIEFDTYSNLDKGDPVSDHTGIMRNGDIDHSVAITAPVSLANLENGGFHTLSITWTPTTKVLAYQLDGILIASITRDIVALDLAGQPNVWWGFTGATGGAINTHRFCVKSFSSGATPTPTLTPSPSVTRSVTPSITPSATITRSATPTRTPSLTATTEASVPAAPIPIRPTGMVMDTTLKPTYRWGAVSGATAYALFIYDLTSMTPVTILTYFPDICTAGFCLATPDIVLRNGSSYGWFAAALNSAGWGPWSQGLAFIIVRPPSAPTQTSPTGTVSTSTLNLTYRWNAVDGGVSYAIAVIDVATGTLKFFQAFEAASVCTGTTCAATPTGAGTMLTSGRQYAWYVVAFSYAGDGPFSAGQTFTPILSAQPAPTFAP